MGSTEAVDRQLPYYLAFNYIDGIGPMRFRALVSYFGSAKAAWEASEAQLSKTGLPKDALDNLVRERGRLDLEGYSAKIKTHNITVLADYDPQYPSRLREIADPPTILFVRGSITVLATSCIAVVGTRKMTQYGKVVTTTLTAGLATAGLTIVSGLAYGVDTQAHRVVVETSGKTIGVLGCGVDCIYPKANEGLARDIIESGGAIISEAPLSRWVSKGMFPSRNRIISGLSKGVLVTEAAEDSGSLITARLAIEQGREVFAVPGPITSPLSKGPADLIKLGAKLVYAVEDILEEFGMTGNRGNRPTVLTSALSKEELLIAQLITNEPKDKDILIRESGVPVAAVSAILTGMELKGYVSCEGQTVRLMVSLSS